MGLILEVLWYVQVWETQRYALYMAVTRSFHADKITATFTPLPPLWADRHCYIYNPFHCIKEQFQCWVWPNDPQWIMMTTWHGNPVQITGPLGMSVASIFEGNLHCCYRNDFCIMHYFPWASIQHIQQNMPKVQVLFCFLWSGTGQLYSYPSRFLNWLRGNQYLQSTLEEHGHYF